MPCQITIFELSALIQENTGELNVITVSGSIDGCDDCGSLIVTLNDTLTTTAEILPNDPSTWVATFLSFGSNPPQCNDLVDIFVQCEDNRDHKVSDRKNLICKVGPAPTPPPSCPLFNIVVTPTDDCNEDGRLVHLDFSFTGSAPEIWHWEFGDGNNSTVLSNLSQTQISNRYDDSISTYTGQLNTVVPTGCAATPFTVQVEPCPNDDTPTFCEPLVVDVQVTDLQTGANVTEIALSSDSEACLPAGSYRSQVVSPNASNQSHHWFKNGSQTPEAGQTTNQIVQQLNDGDQIELIAGVQIDNCNYQSSQIKLKSCEEKDPDPNEGDPPDHNRGDPTREPPVTTVPPETKPPYLDPCILWFWFNIILFVATAIVVVITGCMIEAEALSAIAALASGGTLAAVFAALSAATIAMLIVSALLMLFSLVSFLLWLFICAPNMAKQTLCTLLTILMSILQVLLFFSGVVAVILFLIGHIGCAIGGVVDIAWFGFLSSLTWFVGMMFCNWGSHD